MLGALSNCASVSSISFLNLSMNENWFEGDAGESNMKLLCDAILAMKSLSKMSLANHYYHSERQCDMLITAVTANQEQNSSLKEIVNL